MRPSPLQKFLRQQSNNLRRGPPIRKTGRTTSLTSRRPNVGHHSRGVCVVMHKYTAAIMSTGFYSASSFLRLEHKSRPQCLQQKVVNCFEATISLLFFRQHFLNAVYIVVWWWQNDEILVWLCENDDKCNSVNWHAYSDRDKFNAINWYSQLATGSKIFGDRSAKQN
jgi:hypothetical protein